MESVTIWRTTGHQSANRGDFPTKPFRYAPMAMQAIEKERDGRYD